MNWYTEVLESDGAKSRRALYPTPGLALFSAAIETPFRGLLAIQTDASSPAPTTRVFGVIGFTFYEFFSDGTAMSRGTVAVDDNPATLTSNGDAGGQLFVTSGDKGYCYDLATNMLTLELGSGATMCDFLDGFFLVLDSATSTFRISDLEDGTGWDPTQIAQRTAGADPWVSMKVIHKEIWLLGTQTSEIWFNSGAFPFPFAPNPGAFLEYGTGALFSGARLGASLVWLGANEQGAAMVLRSNGWSGVRISNHALEYALSQLTRPSDAVSFTYQDQGHTFFVLTFLLDDQTWVYDEATGEWHQRGFWNSEASTFEAWRPLYHCYAFGRHLVGDRATGALYRMAIDLYTDALSQGNSAPIRRVRRAPHVNNDGLRVFYPGFQLDIQVGVGPSTTSAGVTPTMSMRTSDDGGMTWSSYREASVGAIGQYGVRVRWNLCGSARDRVFEISCSDPVPYRIVNAYLTPDPVAGSN